MLSVILDKIILQYMEDINPCYQAALAYLAKGFSVIPIMRGDKKPCIKWQLFQKQLPSIDEVNNWFKTFPDAQVGIVTGKISNLIVIDIDKKTGGLESVKNIHLPVTAIVETGGGWFPLLLSSSFWGRNKKFSWSDCSWYRYSGRRRLCSCSSLYPFVR